MRHRSVAVPTFLGGVFSGVYLGGAWLSAERLLKDQPPKIQEAIFSWADPYSPFARCDVQTVSPEMLALEEVK